MNIGHMMRMVIVSVVLTLHLSCVKVDFSSEIPSLKNNTQETDESVVTFEVDWNGLKLSEEEKPDNLMVVMNRIQNMTLHYVWYLDSDGNILLPGFIDPSTEGEDQDDTGEEVVTPGTIEKFNEGFEDGGTDSEEEPEEDADGPEEAVLEANQTRITNGLYSIMAVATKCKEDFVVPEIKEFENSLDVRMRDLWVNMPLLSDDEIKSEDFIDFNPLYPFIRPCGPVYFVRSDNESTTLVSSSANNDNVVKLSPEKLTRKVTFTINADIEKGVVVDRLVGIISGVPYKAQFTTGFVSDQKTGKMPFEMTSDNLSSDGGKAVFKGTANVFGLMPASSQDLVTGPGILNVILHARVDDGGTTRKRVFHASINLKNVIEKTNMMVMTDDMVYWKFSGTSDYSIAVGATLEVTRDKILTTSDQGFEVWKENETGDDPGLNPEI